MGAVTALGGCGFADSHASLPKFMLEKESAPRQIDPVPDVKQLVRDKTNSVFVGNSEPRHVQVSLPRRDTRGSGWTACIKADLLSIVGRRQESQIYVATISGGAITDRRRAGEGDNCESETYEAL